MSGNEGRAGVGEGVERGVEEEAEDAPLAETGDKFHWGEGSKLLFQPGYLKVLKSLALSGQLQQYNIRSVVWRLFLNALPEDQSLWESATIAYREKYDDIKRKHVMDPHQVTASLDITLNNPLSQSEESPWNRFFQDNELRQLVSQDVVRTFPDIQFFRQDHIQQMMEDILFCYVKEHQELGYRQGMHELLAPILFVMHVEMRDVEEDDTLAPVLKVVMDPSFIEHDTFAIFAELMEMVEPWYSCTGLEADQAKARQQASQRKNMVRDPRTSRPFQEDSESSGPSSAISRKLDVVHNVLLKKADEVLFLHLKQLSIPAQTYGIRWIRLLFGREFPLPNVLEVWDALFADGPSLVDYMCVSMLMHIREVLIEGDYATCMHHLMHFPTVYEVNYLIQRSLHLRNPSQNPSPRLWSHHHHHHHQQHQPPSLPTLPPPSPLNHPQTHLSQPSKARQAGAKAKLALSSAGKQLAAGIKRREGGEGKGGMSPASSPPPTTSSTPHLPHNGNSVSKTTTHTAKEPKKGRGKVIGDIGEKEMKNNPKMQVSSSGSMSQVEWLTSRVDDLEAKLAYCGSKMDSLLMSMEDEVSDLTDGKLLSPEAENTLLLSLAGLKHVRDILLNKIAFSGAMLKDEHNVIVQKPQDDLNRAHPLELSVQYTPTSQVSQEPLSVAGSNGDASSPQEQDTPPGNVPHPLMSSGEMEQSTRQTAGEEEDWINIPIHSHPLVNSDS